MTAFEDCLKALAERGQRIRENNAADSDDLGGLTESAAGAGYPEKDISHIDSTLEPA